MAKGLATRDEHSRFSILRYEISNQCIVLSSFGQLQKALQVNKCTIPAYSMVISYRLLTQHTVHARESLAMICVNATVTQHNSAGDSFFLSAPVRFHSCSSSPLYSNGCFFSSCTLYNSSIIYILYSHIKNNIEKVL